jgi:sugar phosphate isomerase/epimerase
MMHTPHRQRLAVCSWSLQPPDPETLIRHMKEIGLSRMQIALDPLRDSPGVWAALPDLCRDHKFTLVSGMIGTVGEDYSTLESIRRTGGLVPDSTWDQNRSNLRVSARLARELGLKLVSLHAGFIPHETSDPEFQTLLERLRFAADTLAAEQIDLAFETGQETASELASFLKQLDRPTVGVNFDPANMLLYDKGDPIAALRVLGPWLKQIHIKDARKTRTPGTWGDEVVVGTGEVDWKAFFRTLTDLNYSGWCCIEREAGEQRVADIRAACKFVETIPESERV